MDNSERRSCRGLGLVLRQSVKSLEYCLDIPLLEKVLYKFDCVVLSNVKRQQKWTHLIVSA